MIGGELVMALAEATGARLLPVDSEHSALFQLIGGRGAGNGRAAGPDRLRRALPRPHRPRRGQRRGRARAPDLADGRADHDRLGDADEQGLRGDRGAPPLRRPLRADRRRRPPAVDRPLADRPQRRLHARPPRLPRHAGADLLRAALPRARRRRRAAARPRRGRRADLRGSPTSRPSPACAWRCEAGEAGGTAPCVLNAADEVAVAAFLDGRIRFTGDRRGDRAGAGGDAGPAGRPTSTTSSPPTPRRAERSRRAGPGVDARMSWLCVFLGFCLLIILHEAGHFFAAKATGMRVERFFLFFGPTIWSFKRGETEYGVKAIPLGGYVKITGMNPEEEVPPEDRAPRLLPPAGLEADRRDRRRARRSTSSSPSLILFGVYLRQRPEGRPDGRRSRCRARPAAKVLEPGDRIVAVDGKRYPGLDHEDAPRTVRRSRSRSHECAGKQVDGCVAATPVKLTIERDGEPQTISVRPEYDKAAKRALIGFSYGSEPERPRRRRGRRPTPATRSGWSPPSTARRLRPHLRIRSSASRSPASSGSATSANQAIDVGLDRVAAAARPGQPLAGPDQPAADPAARRRPHLLEPGREAARRAGLAAGDGAGERDRLRPGADALLHRPLQRHRPPHRRRLQRPLAAGSTLKRQEAGVGSSSPPPRARTWKRCLPGVSGLVVKGERQAR